jgi:hypothetical protein
LIFWKAYESQMRTKGEGREVGVWGDGEEDETGEYENNMRTKRVGGRWV